jgi:hypothetical protein
VIRVIRKRTLVSLLLLVACDAGDVVLLAPTSKPNAPTLSIRAVLDTPYTPLADSLGWAAAVPGATVRVHLMTEPYDSSYWHETTADSTGVATFPDLLAGLYEVLVVRRLTAAESGRASGVRVVAGGRRIWLPVRDAQDVTLAPNRRGSLVFSELSMDILGDVNYLAAGDAKYFEVYNNSDTTIYLDGKYWGMGWHFIADYQSRPCGQTEPWRNDPDGIWTTYLFRFPGRGSDYPLPPRATALVARAAIDHRAVDPRLMDLRGAAFEWGGQASPDNPDVPNLEQVGPSMLPAFFPEPVLMPEFLADSVDLATLPRYIEPINGNTWLRMPAALVLDAWATPEDWTTDSPPYQISSACLEDLNHAFERLPGPAGAFGDFERGVSFQRRVLAVLPDGRKVLQDTDTSMEDFVKALRSPGWIPDSLP